ADRQAQEIILQHILGAFPRDAVCAEEATPTVQQAAPTGERMWVVDPIDGTRGFAMKNGEFSVMIGFIDHGNIGVGVVGQPAIGRLTYAVRGGGCWRLDQKNAAASCHVTSTGELTKATLTQSRSRQPGTASPLLKALAPARIVESYSAGIKLAL